MDQLNLAGADTRGLWGGHPSTDRRFVKTPVKLTDGPCIQLVAEDISDADPRSSLMRLGLELGLGALFDMDTEMGRLANPGEPATSA